MSRSLCSIPARVRARTRAEIELEQILNSLAFFFPRGILSLYCITTVTWYNARVSKLQCEYRFRAVTFYFAELEGAHDQKDLP